MQRMRDVLRESLGLSLEALSELDRLAAAWPVACGATLARHGEIEELDEKRVAHVVVDGPQWMEEFLHARTALKQTLARTARVPLAGIHFEERGRAAASARRTPR
jgi:hypothetical protein